MLNKIHKSNNVSVSGALDSHSSKYETIWKHTFYGHGVLKCLIKTFLDVSVMF